MKDWSRGITIPKPGWFVTVSKFWWEDWKDWLNADSDIPLCLDDRYRLGWSDFSEKDWNAEPFLVVSSKIDIAYVKSIGCVPNVEVHFLVGEKLKHIFAEVVWWHPYTSQTSSYCDECCTPYDKNVFIGRWRETKATLVARDMFNRQPLKLISDKLGFKESHKKDICHLVGLLTWDFHHLKEVGIKQPLLDFIQWITTQEPEE